MPEADIKACHHNHAIGPLNRCDAARRAHPGNPAFRYPDGRFFEKAHAQIDAIVSAEEDRDWRAAKRTGAADALEEFLSKYPSRTSKLHSLSINHGQWSNQFYWRR